MRNDYAPHNTHVTLTTQSVSSPDHQATHKTSKTHDQTQQKTKHDNTSDLTQRSNTSEISFAPISPNLLSVL